MLRLLSLIAVLLLLTLPWAHAQPSSPSAKPSARAQAELERVVVITVDGLRPVDALRFPTLKHLAETGAFAAPPDGALSITPSVTYPAHTSIATGVVPARHGITTNQMPDPTPDNKNQGGWRWYADDIRVPTLWDVAFDQGMRTALITWPVTVHARATACMPEYWRAGTGEDIKILRALATPSWLFRRVEKEHPGFAERYTPPHVKDSATIDAALTVLDTIKPQLMFMHVWQSDDAQHEFGPESAQADAALANADAEIARLLARLRKSAAWPNTVLVIASDHGFAPLHSRIFLNVHLAKAGLSDRAYFSTNSGFAYIYPKVKEYEPVRDEVLAHFRKLAEDPAHGIARVLTHGEIESMGGDTSAIVGLEAQPGFVFGKRDTESTVERTTDRGTHGYLPDRPEMRATLIIAGPRVPRQTLRGARLVDIAPTLAHWLGLTLPHTDGKRLDIALRPQRLPRGSVASPNHSTE